jgi:hypothetical protein
MARYNIEFSGETNAALDSLAKHAASKADAIRKAISVAKWVDDTQRSGAKILVKNPDGSFQEVIWH